MAFLPFCVLASNRTPLDSNSTKLIVTARFDSVVKMNDSSYYLYVSGTLANNSSETLKYCSTLCHSPFICDNKELELDIRLSCDTDGVVIESIPPYKTKSLSFALKLNKSTTKLSSKEFRIGLIYYTPNEVGQNESFLFNFLRSKYNEIAGLRNHLIWSNEVTIQ